MLSLYNVKHSPNSRLDVTLHYPLEFPILSTNTNFFFTPKNHVKNYIMLTRLVGPMHEHPRMTSNSCQKDYIR